MVKHHDRRWLTLSPQSCQELFVRRQWHPSDADPISTFPCCRIFHLALSLPSQHQQKYRRIEELNSLGPASSPILLRTTQS